MCTVKQKTAGVVVHAWIPDQPGLDSEAVLLTKKMRVLFHSPVIECLLSMLEALGSISSTTKKQNENLEHCVL